MICKVLNTILKYNMLKKGDSVVVALSGGADSMALMYSLLEIKEELDLTVKACHVNHGIRGESADSDEHFVREVCQKLGVELHVLHADIPSLAGEQGLGLEECGRRVRYAYFNEIADGAAVATAHTLSDRCETLLLNHVRGASLKGLCSIPPVRENIIRPLIECTRKEIEDYCKEHNINYVTDKTNFDDTYSRNRIRLRVIPHFKKINPSYEQAVQRLIDSVSEDEDCLNGIAESLFVKIHTDKGINVNDILSVHPAVKRRVIALILKKDAGVTPELKHIRLTEEILSGGKTEIINNTVIAVENGILTVNPEKVKTEDWEFDFSYMEAVTPAGKITGTIVNKNDLTKKQIVHNKVLDYDSIKGKCVVRNRRAGDKFHRAGSSCTKTLKKLFNEKHIENRDSLPILADEQGIIWISGIGCADRCKIKEDTKRILIIGGEKYD